jgi:hypothetical protein
VQELPANMPPGGRFGQAGNQIDDPYRKQHQPFLESVGIGLCHGSIPPAYVNRFYFNLVKKMTIEN